MDGTTRPVFELLDGRQYVEADGERVSGTWLPPADEPVSVSIPPRRPASAPKTPGRKRPRKEG
jgi:hypothetical protein